MSTATEATEASGSASPRKRSARKSTAPKPEKKTGRKPMTDEHKDAIKEGREQARAIGHYLTALESTRPKRGRKVTKESRQARLEAVEKEIAGASPLDRVNLIAERARLREFLSSDTTEEVDIDELEKDFVKYAAAYSERKQIPRKAWQEAGVPKKVLDAAGISR